LNEYHLRIPGLQSEAILEVSEYLKQSFGDRERIDYGSGHELNFMCWLYIESGPKLISRLCLRELHVLIRDDYAPLVLLVFNRYDPDISSLN